MPQQRMTILPLKQRPDLLRQKYLTERARLTQHKLELKRSSVRGRTNRAQFDEQQLFRMALNAFRAEQTRAGKHVAPELADFVNSPAGRKRFSAQLEPLRSIPKTRAEIHKRLLALKSQKKQVRQLVSEADKKIRALRDLTKTVESMAQVGAEWGKSSSMKSAKEYAGKLGDYYEKCGMNIDNLSKVVGFTKEILDKISRIKNTTINLVDKADILVRLPKYADTHSGTFKITGTLNEPIGTFTHRNGSINIRLTTIPALKEEIGKIVSTLAEVADEAQLHLLYAKDEQRAAYASVKPAEKEANFLKQFVNGKTGAKSNARTELTDKEMEEIYKYYRKQT